MTIKIFIIFFIVFALSRTLRQFRSRQIALREFFFWFLFWLGVGVVAVYPGVASRLASIVGVGRGVDLFIYAALLALFYIVFRIFVRLERIEQNISKITTAIALREDAAHTRTEDTPQ